MKSVKLALLAAGVFAVSSISAVTLSELYVILNKLNPHEVAGKCFAVEDGKKSTKLYRAKLDEVAVDRYGADFVNGHYVFENDKDFHHFEECVVLIPVEDTKSKL